MKRGYVAIIGRPNSGKSTLLNNLLGQKVSITSPKPQTTRFPIQALYEDERGQIVFIDTPGIFARTPDTLSQKINLQAEKTLRKGVDLILYLVDHTRERDIEENKTFGLLRTIDKPKILVINKIDIQRPSFLAQYRFLEEEFFRTIKISALYKFNLNVLLETIFELLPEGEKIFEKNPQPTPALNLNSKIFLAEIIREKAFLFLRKEVPYTLTVIIEEISERSKNLLYIKAKILTLADRYRKMIIGEKGKMIKEIGMAARKELETATNKKIYLELRVETNPHWPEEF